MDAIAAEMENGKLPSSLVGLAIGPGGGVAGRNFCGCQGKLAGDHNRKSVGIAIGRLGYAAVGSWDFGRRDAGMAVGTFTQLLL